MNPNGSSWHPHFISAGDGELFLLHHEAPGARRNHAVVFAPPFAEEMNKARRQYALQARALAAAGIGAVQPDLFGSGDSDGDFGAATWSRWIDDLAAACDFARNAGYQRVSLLGVRAGALLAVSLAARRIPSLSSCVLWQPVVSGKTLINQFLRLRVAAGITSSESGDTVDGLRERLQSGTAVEVAGYTISPTLFVELNALELNTLVPTAVRHINWFSIVAREGAAASVAERRALDDWRGGGAEVVHRCVVADPFWSTAEISTAPELIHATTTALAEDHQ